MLSLFQLLLKEWKVQDYWIGLDNKFHDSPIQLKFVHCKDKFDD